MDILLDTHTLPLYNKSVEGGEHMYTVTVTYSDKNIRYREINHVTKITYHLVTFDYEIVGDEILTHEFPTSTPLRLFSETQQTIIYPDKIIDLQITKE